MNLIPSFWVMKIAPGPREFSLVAGFEASIPWSKLDLASVSTLEDLGRLSEFGIGIPPEAFMAGVEEFELTFVGDQFSFSLPLSDHGLQLLHEMASSHFAASGGGKSAPLSLGSSFSGIQLLEMFLQQLLPHSRRTDNKKRSIFAGMSGPGGKAIRFYPSMPLPVHKKR